MNATRFYIFSFFAFWVSGFFLFMFIFVGGIVNKPSNKVAFTVVELPDYHKCSDRGNDLKLEYEGRKITLPLRYSECRSAPHHYFIGQKLFFFYDEKNHLILEDDSGHVFFLILSVFPWIASIIIFSECKDEVISDIRVVFKRFSIF